MEVDHSNLNKVVFLNPSMSCQVNTFPVNSGPVSYLVCPAGYGWSSDFGSKEADPLFPGLIVSQAAAHYILLSVYQY